MSKKAKASKLTKAEEKRLLKEADAEATAVEVSAHTLAEDSAVFTDLPDTDVDVDTEIEVTIDVPEIDEGDAAQDVVDEHNI